MALSFLRDTITHSTTGVKTMTVGFQPVEAQLVVAPAPGTTFTNARRSLGITDGTNQVCDSDTEETTRIFQRRYSDRMISISEWNGTAWAETFKITFDSFTATEFKYNVNVGNANFQVHRIVRG